MKQRTNSVLAFALLMSLAAGCGPFATSTHYQIPARHVLKPSIPNPFDPEMGAAAGRFFVGSAEVTGNFISCIGTGSSSADGAALVVVAAVAVVPLAVGAIPVAGWVGYSVVGTGSAAVSHTVRTVAIDAPKAIGHRFRTRKGQIQEDIRRLVKLWKGPGRRPNRWLAIRGSRGSIIAHAQRLEQTTRRRIGANPADWIDYYEKKYGAWKWERP